MLSGMYTSNQLDTSSDQKRRFCARFFNAMWMKPKERTNSVKTEKQPSNKIKNRISLLPLPYNSLPLKPHQYRYHHLLIVITTLVTKSLHIPSGTFYYKNLSLSNEIDTNAISSKWLLGTW